MRKFLLLALALAGTLSLSACDPPIRQAEEHLQKAEYAQAQALLERILARQDAPPEAAPLLAQALFYTQGPEAAMQHLRKIRESHQKSVSFRNVVSQLRQEYAALDKLSENASAEALAKYLERQPPVYFRERAQWMHYLHSRGQAAALRQKLESARSPLIQQLARWERARLQVNEFKSLLQDFPQSPFRGLWYQAILNDLLAKEENQKAQNLLLNWKNELQDDSPQRAEVLLHQAELSTENHVNAALNYYRNFLRHFPEHPRGREAIYTIREDLAEQLNASDHRFLAEQAEKRYMYQTAYSELVQAPPRNAAELFRQGEYALKAKYYRQASGHYQSVINNYPQSLQAGLARVRQARLARISRNYAGALQQLSHVRKAYRSVPQVHAAALWEVGILDDLQNKDAQRAQVYKQLLEVDPEYEEAMSALWHAVWFDYRAQKYEQVVEQLTRHAKYYKEHELRSRLRYWLARSYEELEKLPEAQKIYTELSQNPLMDYYTHRARERLRVMKHGGGDLYATHPYQGYKKLQEPGYEQAFEQVLGGQQEEIDAPMELYYLGQHTDFMNLADLSSEPRYQVLHGRLMHRQKRYYEAVTRYRYLAEKDDRYLPAAFPLAFFETIETEAKRYGLNPFLACGLIWQESQYKPDIKSWVGATGLMQIMPSTGAQIANELELEQYSLTDAQMNIKMGTYYLYSRHKVFDNNPLLAVASYNAGAGPVYRWLKESGHLPYDGLAESITYPETRGYVKHVFTSYWIYQALYGR